MRNYTNSSKKTSFPAIWAGLSESQRSTLRANIIVKLRISDITLYRWHRGESVPRHFSVRRDAASVVSELLGRDISAEELFPLDK